MDSDSPRPDVRAALIAAAHAELVEHGLSAMSLRAVARRAGVSHAAPKHHFGDRAGLLTAVATEGFQAFTGALGQVAESDPQQQLAALGRVYVDFGLTNPALFELMFAANEVDPADAALTTARSEAFGTLSAAVDIPKSDEAAATPPLALMSWAFVHGLVVLARGGALQRATGAEDDKLTELIHALTDRFSEFLKPGFVGQETHHSSADHPHGQ